MTTGIFIRIHLISLLGLFRLLTQALSTTITTLPYLHLDRVLITSASPYCRPPAERSGGEGVQVDLLLQTRKSICIVEIKRRQHIGREVVAEMEEKCRRITRPQGVSLKTALVYDGELAPSVEADGYFDAIVPASRLLGM